MGTGLAVKFDCDFATVIGIELAAVGLFPLRASENFKLLADMSYVAQIHRGGSNVLDVDFGWGCLSASVIDDSALLGHSLDELAVWDDGASGPQICPKLTILQLLK